MTRNIMQSTLRALVIHAPMKRTYIVESFGNPIANERMHLVSQLAQNMHGVHGEPVVVVIHQELTLAQMMDFGLIDKISATMKELLHCYPDVVYGFENLSALTFKDGEFSMTPNFFDASPRLAEYLRSRLNTDRVGTVLDTCHAMISETVMSPFVDYGYRFDYSLESYFERFKDTLVLIHLSNARNLGEGKDHGIGFNSEAELVTLTKIIKKIIDIGYTGSVTLEVLEEHPETAIRYSVLSEQINTLSL